MGPRQAMPERTVSAAFSTDRTTVLGLRIGTEETPADYVAAGLFAYADGAIIHNVAIENAQINIKRTDSVRIYAGHRRRCYGPSPGTAQARITRTAAPSPALRSPHVLKDAGARSAVSWVRAMTA